MKRPKRCVTRQEPAISPVAVQPRNNHLTGVHLMGMHITGVHPIGVYLMGVHLIDVYFVDVYMFPNPKRLWGKPPDLPPYKSTTRLQDGGSGACLIGVCLMGVYLMGAHLMRNASWACTS